MIEYITFDKSGTTLIRCPKYISGNCVVPETTMFIKHEAFRDCKQLTSIELPYNIQYIGYGAFKGCSRLVYINIPSSVQYIHNELLKGCTSLKEIHIQWLTP